MAKNARAVIAAALLAVLAILLVLSDYPLVGAGVFVVGMLGLALIREREEGAANDDGQAKLDRAIEDRGTTITEPAPRPGPTSTRPTAGGGLPTWQPTSRPAPEAERDRGPTAEPTGFAGLPPLTPSPAAPDTSAHPAGSSWDAWQDADRDRGPIADEYDDQNPLAALDRLDEIDPIAEVERIERMGPAPQPGRPAASGAFSFSSAPALINEAAVRTDDDIMAASQATELQVGSGQDSELARLLAKVQQRLAAYE